MSWSSHDWREDIHGPQMCSFGRRSNQQDRVQHRMTRILGMSRTAVPRPRAVSCTTSKDTKSRHSSTNKPEGRTSRPATPRGENRRRLKSPERAPTARGSMSTEVPAMAESAPASVTTRIPSRWLQYFHDDFRWAIIGENEDVYFYHKTQRRNNMKKAEFVCLRTEQSLGRPTTNHHLTSSSNWSQRHHPQVLTL